MSNIDEKYRKWNFEIDDESLLVCEGLHGNQEHCDQYYRRLTNQELLDIILELREEGLELFGRLMKYEPKTDFRSVEL